MMKTKTRWGEEIDVDVKGVVKDMMFFKKINVIKEMSALLSIEEEDLKNLIQKELQKEVRKQKILKLNETAL